MSHIVEFSIENLAGRGDVYTQTLDRYMNVFFGLNGSGKTSLLKILHSAMSGNSGILRNVPFRSAEVKIYSIQYDRVFTHTIEKKPTKPAKERGRETDTTDVFTSFEELLDFSVTFQKGIPRAADFPDWKIKPRIREEHERGWRHRYLPTSRLYLGLKTRKARLARTGLELVSEEQLDLYFAETLQALWADYYADIVTAISEAQEDGLASIIKAIVSGKKPSRKTAQKVDIETAYERVATFLERQGSPGVLGSLEDFEKDYNENEQLRSIVSDINEVEKRIAEAMAPRDKLQSLIRDMFSGNKEVCFRGRSIDVVTNSEEDIGLNTLSSGEKHVLRILIETLLSGENSILIDEPEISMHVDWQRELIKTMRQLNPEAQLILATHSPEIMADVSDDRIYRL